MDTQIKNPGLELLWQVAHEQSRPWRDLLALIDAPTRYQDFRKFPYPQQAALADALSDLAWGDVTEEILTRHIERFARWGIDVTEPLRGKPAPR